jgi:hypothetical protein
MCSAYASMHAHVRTRSRSEVACVPVRTSTCLSLSRARVHALSLPLCLSHYIHPSLLPLLVTQVSEEDVVMAVFSQAFKIDWRIVDVWAHILLQVQGLGFRS